MSDLVRPRALFLDFGGVLYSSVPRPEGREEMVDAVQAVLERAGADGPPRPLIQRDLEVARVAESSWKTAASRTAKPSELPRDQYWGEFVAADWSSSARAALVASSLALSRTLVESVSGYVPRPGIRELLAEAADQEVPVAVVSNTRSGEAFRAIVRRDGLEDLLTLQIYSDEVGLRKPNPDMLGLAASALGVPLAQCWYAGDHYDRDVMCARRAGIGVAILVHDRKTLRPPYSAQSEPDVEVASPAELVALLAEQRGVVPTVTHVGSSHRGPTAERSSNRARRTSQPRRPAALLLDHGGVIVTSRKSPEGRAAFAARVATFLSRTGWIEFDASRIARDLEEAHRLHGESKVSLGAIEVPEVNHLEFFRDLLARSWPEHPRAAVAAHASALMLDHVSTRSERTIRPGMLKLMQRCADAHVPIGIVSNTLCGAVPRALSVEFGTAPFIGVEIYSDELGRRKPDPITIETAARALDVDPAECWYVGDKPNRDLACARRAGVGRAILMRRPNESELRPDADLIVTEPAELLAHLETAL